MNNMFRIVSIIAFLVTFLGIALFSEIPTTIFVLGAVLVLIGIVAVALKE